MNGAGAGGGVSSGGGHVIELRVSGSGNSNSRPDAIAIAFGALELEFEPVVSPRAVIHPDFRRSAERGHHYVELAVMIEVADCVAAVTRPASGSAAKEASVEIKSERVTEPWL